MVLLPNALGVQPVDLLQQPDDPGGLNGLSGALVLRCDRTHQPDDPIDVATGLGATSAARQPKPQLVLNNVVAQKTGTDNLPGPVNYNELDSVPAVIRRNRASTVEALQQSGVDKYDIPAFLRKQAD